MSDGFSSFFLMDSSISSRVLRGAAGAIVFIENICSGKQSKKELVQLSKTGNHPAGEKSILVHCVLRLFPMPSIVCEAGRGMKIEETAGSLHGMKLAGIPEGNRGE